jgi:hypothetical protein
MHSYRKNRWLSNCVIGAMLCASLLVPIGMQRSHAQIGTRVVQTPGTPTKGPIVNNRPPVIKEIKLDPPAALQHDFSIFSGVYQENTAKVIPPGGGCQNGSITVATGQPRSTAALLNRRLFDNSGNLDLATTSTKSVEYPIGSTKAIGTDNQLIRLKDGSLLATKDSYDWDIIPLGTPPWFGEKVSGSGDCANSDDLDTCHRQRGAILVFHSTDCGAHWTPLSTIDSASLLGGKYGYPRPMGDRDGDGDNDPKTDHDGDGDKDVDVPVANQSAYPDGSLKWWVGGFDRTEIYACPFTGNIYLTTKAVSGPYKNVPKRDTGLLLYSTNGGKSWTTLREDLSDWLPLVMTSTLDGRLFLFQQVGHQNFVYFSQKLIDPVTHTKSKPVVGPGYEVYYEQRGQKITPVDPEDIKANIDLQLQGDHPSISRVSTDTKSSSVRIAYHSMNGRGMQEARVIGVAVKEDNQPPTVTSITTIRAQDPTNFSTVYFTFIDPDYIDMPASAATNTSLFYWIEAPRVGLAGGRKYAIGSVLFKDGFVSPPTYLSIKAGSAGPWFTTNKTWDVGDYMSGGFFWRNNTLNYLAQWVEPTGIRANIVTLPMEIKSTVPDPRTNNSLPKDQRTPANAPPMPRRP